MENKVLNVLPTAIGVALLPPIWAVVSASFGITFGWVSLACAGMYFIIGDPVRSGIKTSVSFLMGCLWGLAATVVINRLPINKIISLFAVLCVYGFVAVICSELILKKRTVLSAWLGSWAIALGVFGQAEPHQFGIILIKLIIAMLVSVWYIVLFNQKFQKLLKQIIKRKKQ